MLSLVFLLCVVMGVVFVCCCWCCYLCDLCIVSRVAIGAFIVGFNCVVMCVVIVVIVGVVIGVGIWCCDLVFILVSPSVVTCVYMFIGGISCDF